MCYEFKVTSVNLCRYTLPYAAWTLVSPKDPITSVAGVLATRFRYAQNLSYLKFSTKYLSGLDRRELMLAWTLVNSKDSITFVASVLATRFRLRQKEACEYNRTPPHCPARLCCNERIAKYGFDR